MGRSNWKVYEDEQVDVYQIGKQQDQRTCKVTVIIPIYFEATQGSTLSTNTRRTKIKNKYHIQHKAEGQRRDRFDADEIGTR